MKSLDYRVQSGLWHEAVRVYGFPFVMFALAIVPGLNFTYSGHGGFSWFFVPLCAPWVLIQATLKTVKASREKRGWYFRFFGLTIPSYVAVSLPLSFAATSSLKWTFGLQVSTWQFFSIMVSPFPWWYFR